MFLQTIMTMLHDRNYLVSQRELEMTMQQFADQFGDNPEYVGWMGAVNKQAVSTIVILCQIACLCCHGERPI